jgi:hypothetical protein
MCSDYLFEYLSFVMFEEVKKMKERTCVESVSWMGA